MVRFTFIFLLSLFVQSSSAQSDWTIVGKIIDDKSKEAIPFASALLKNSDNDEIVAGVTTDINGDFTLETSTNKVYLEIKFVGYLTRILPIVFDSNMVDLGNLCIEPNAESLGELNITAEKSSMEFKLDKRVFNVGQDISSTGMGAMEVLNNVPSVNVDIEGNVSLRGNQGVQILIDGKPSVMADDLSSALGSISADMIEKIEVITNPSAKYNAEGTSGIINIVLKKEEKKGVNGSISFNTGWPHNHSVGGSINLRANKFNFFTQFGAGYRSLPRYEESINQSYIDSSKVESDGVNYRNENFYNITLGTDYYINDYNTITLSGNFAYEIEQQPSETEFWLYDGNNDLVSNYKRTEVTSALNPKFQYDFNYVRESKNNKDHKLQFSALGRSFSKDQSSEFNNVVLIGSDAYADQQTRTDFYQTDYTFKLDYTNPLNDKWSIESGAMYEINDVGNDYGVYDDDNGVWVSDSSLTNNFVFVQKVLGLYATGAYESEKWGVKVGLRAENTDLNTLLENTGQSNNQFYTNLFPSIHSSYKINKKFSMQIGYSRRIFRPRLWDLNPFFNIRNSYNIRTGNPNLLPEYGDSYELTAIYMNNKFSLNGSVYYLRTTEVVERITVLENNVNITMPMNIGTRDKVGIELNGDVDINKSIDLNGDFNFGYFNRRGTFNGQNFDFISNQWSSRATMKIKLPANFDIEITGNYQSKFETVQGVTSGYLFGDIGMRKKLWKGKGVINFSVRDIMASRIRENTVVQDDYYVYAFSQRGRFITLGFSYSFGKGEAMTYNGGRRH